MLVCERMITKGELFDIYVFYITFNFGFLSHSKLDELEVQLKQQHQQLEAAKEQSQQLEAELRKQRSSQLTMEAVKASAELAESRCAKALHVSPPLSLVDDSGSTEDALGGIIDWQGVSKVKRSIRINLYLYFLTILGRSGMCFKQWTPAIRHDSGRTSQLSGWQHNNAGASASAAQAT